MISVPLPLFLTFLSAVIGALVLTRTWLPGPAKAFFAALAALIAVETLFVALRFAYQIEDVLVVQRLLPFWIGPLLYLGYVALSDRAARLQRHVLRHLGIATLLTVVVAASPPVRIALDLLIGLSYAAYAVLLLRLWRAGPDRLSKLALAHIGFMRRMSLVGVVLLTVTCAMDTLIAVDFARNAGANVARLLSVASIVLILLLIGAVVFTMRRSSGAPPAQSQSTQDAEIAAQARRFLTDSRLYVDPQLSLTRLARRLGVTDRALSEAVNRSSGKNVSQFINEFRVAEAAELLRATTDPVGAVGEAAGFLTRSNFYAEFQRVMGQSPGAYRKGAG
ncbi:helix-turn-helix domain-containing protein [Roseobacter sp. YSTF-M11]|uniref:Helix-turn-helix domain-containing protein n=1 Tax=Roseobacter insulae TaxID=2859783 RepID=A0A9X1FUR0_9RHOB|nr:helix-turn-helix domain-containing protein [Roseobacter insulae]MBW4708033.1 helix-turn-helix domain-containing protein [Roseobacter insulae]